MPKANSGLRPGLPVHVHARFFKNIASNQFQNAFRGQNQPALGVIVSQVRDGVFMVKFNNRIEIELKQTILKLLPNGHGNAPLPPLPQPLPQPPVDTDDLQFAVSVLRDTLATVEPEADKRVDNLSLDDGTANDDETEPLEDELTEGVPQDNHIHNDADAWNWVDDEVYIDPRPIVGPHIQHFAKGWFKKPNLESATPGQLFAAFLPCEYIEREMIPAMNRFQDILACHTFQRGTPPDDEVGNRYWPIDAFWEAYNQNLAETVIPSWKMTIDESMNQWRGKKYDDAPQEFDDKGKVIGGMLRLVKPWMGVARTVYADSYFGSPASAVALMEKGLFSVMHVKKRRYFPKGVPVDIISSLPDELGSYIARTASVPRKPHIKLLLVSQMDRKPQCVISTGGTTIQGSEVSRSEYLVGGARVIKKFRPIHVLEEYASAKGAIDVNNNVRDNKKNFHDVMRSPNWQVRVLAFALAIAESNAYLAYRAYIHNKPNTRPSHMKYWHEIVTSLLTEEYASDEIRKMVSKEDDVPVTVIHRMYIPEAPRRPAQLGAVGTPPK
ncbi:hypothetical protein BGZ82_003455, partial [Podila clonocystis]